MNYRGEDFYCDVALKDKEALEKVYESAHVLAYHHTNPHWEHHVVIVPKKHIDSFTKLGAADAPILSEMLEVAQKVARTMEREEGGARILTNLGEYQDSKHFHIHVSAGEEIELPELELPEDDQEKEKKNDTKKTNSSAALAAAPLLATGAVAGVVLGAGGALYWCQVMNTQPLPTSTATTTEISTSTTQNGPSQSISPITGTTNAAQKATTSAATTSDPSSTTTSPSTP